MIQMYSSLRWERRTQVVVLISRRNCGSILLIGRQEDAFRSEKKKQICTHSRNKALHGPKEL